MPFVVEDSTADVTEAQVRALQTRFRLPDLWSIDDGIANGTARTVEGEPKPLALFSAERVDYSLHRLAHYTGIKLNSKLPDNVFTLKTTSNTKIVRPQ